MVSAQRVEADEMIVRKAAAHDREGLVEVFTDPEVRTYLGGVKPRADVERFLDTVGVANVTSTPGAYIIAEQASDQFRGMISLCRRPPDRPGHVLEGGDELELSYVLRRSAWGKGIAFLAATAILRAAAAELPDQPVLLITQSANARSCRLAARLGFGVVDVFTEHAAEQTLSITRLSTFKD